MFAKVAFHPRSGSGEEKKTFEDVIRGFDTDRHRVMLVENHIRSGERFTPHLSYVDFLPPPPFFFFLKTWSRLLRICSNYSIFSC